MSRPRPIALLARALPALALTLALAACSSGPPLPPRLDWQGLLVVADADANRNSPVALDIVFVRDLATLDRLLAMPAARWFASRAELLLGHPGDLGVRSVELVPGQRLRLTEAELGSPRVAGVLLFADYLGPGEHRARLPELRDGGGLVRLGARDLAVTPQRF